MGRALEAEPWFVPVLARLQELGEQERRKMPVRIDILENKAVGRSSQNGRHEGLHTGEFPVLRRRLTVWKKGQRA